MNLHQKLVAIRTDIDGFTKDKKSFNYSYVSGTQVLAKIQKKMNELGVLLVPKILSQEFEKHEYTNAKGKSALDFLVYGQMTYTWINAENPDDTLEIPFYYTGAQDDISKAFGSGLTYSERYFVIKFFNLPTDADDPDARDTSGRSGKYNKQQQPQYQQHAPQQQYNTAPQQSSNFISEAQVKMIKALIGNVVKATRTDASMVVDLIKTNLKIAPEVRTNELTKGQASAFIKELQEMEKGR